MRMGRQPQIHANSLQGLPIAVLSLFKGLARGNGKYMRLGVQEYQASWPGSSRPRGHAAKSVANSHAVLSTY